MPSKNDVTLRRVSSIVLSLRMDMRSIAEELLSSGFRKSMQSMNPPEGKLSSNIMIRRISSVRSSLFLICEGLVEKVSVAVLSAAYAVEHLSEMICLTLSNPIFCSSRVSMNFFLVSNSFSPGYFSSSIEVLRRSFNSLMFWIGVTLPPLTNEILPVSSETTMTSASYISVMPIAALWRIP